MVYAIYRKWKVLCFYQVIQALFPVNSNKLELRVTAELPMANFVYFYTKFFIFHDE